MNKTNNANKKRKVFLLITVLFVLMVTGCAPGEISQWKAKKLVVQNLEEKYGGEFEVRSVERQELGMSWMKDHIYAMEVYSKDLDGTFHVEIFRNGSRMNDGYEQLKYGKQIEDEINSIEYEEEGWVLRKLIINHKNLIDRSASVDIRDYKKNADKLLIVLFIDILHDVNSNTDSLFAYIDALQRAGYRISVHLERNGSTEILSEKSDSEFITEEQISNALKEIEADG